MLGKHYTHRPIPPDQKVDFNIGYLSFLNQSISGLARCSVGTGAYCQLELAPWDSHSGRKEATWASCSLTST